MRNIHGEQSAQDHASQVIVNVMHVFQVDQSEIGAIVRLTQAQISRKLSGKTKWTLSEIDAIAQKFGSTIAHFFHPDTTEIINDIPDSDWYRHRSETRRAHVASGRVRT